MEVQHPLKKFRIDAEMTQASLAHRVGCDRSTIAGIEAGLRDPSAELLRKICEATGLSADVLLSHGQPAGDAA